ncbi:MAG: porin [Bacteroidetes bacterium]|nr:MAG: porin [Bacteroidota bacterium]
MLSQKILLMPFILLAIGALAQPDSAWQVAPKLSQSGFADVYYAFDFNQPSGNQRQNFLFNHNRHNQFSLNLGLMKLALEHPKYRTNLAFQAGTYANDNYAAENGSFKQVFEANLGLSLSRKNKLWLDAGIFPSHIGFESAISAENPTLTRSLVAESSPYFLTGAKMTYQPSDHWEMAALLVNGWQRIRRLEENSLLSYGTQLRYSPGSNTTLNWSTFIGTDDPDSTRRMRYFSHIYGQFQLARCVLIAGFDVGFQQKSKSSTSYNSWYGPVLIGQMNWNEHWKTAVRAEYYVDESGVIIPTGSLHGFQTSGISVNVDYLPQSNIMFRLEGRWFNSKDAVFANSAGSVRDNVFIATSLAIKFAELLSGRNPSD